MLEITNLRDGAILNRHHGTETSDCLEITVEGIADTQAEVTVNGQAVRRRDRNFSAKVRLTRRINRITAEASDYYGVRTLTLTVMWDKASFKRYNFFFDDCSFFLRWIALNQPASLFDEMFLGRLKSIHEKYGSRFMLNLFFHDDHHDFSISDFPADYKGEFQANRDWLRLSFHARSEFPDRPYQNASGATLAADFDEIYREVCRFAGPECFIPPMVFHWAMTNPENFRVLQERGTRCLAGGFIGCLTALDEKHVTEVTDIGYHYEQDVARYVRAAHLMYDRKYDLVLLNNLCCCNFDDIPTLRRRFAAIEPDRDTLSLMTHEQYSYPEYFNHIPDHLDRVEEACRLATEAGFAPVWFPEGLLGNTAWEK